jgi:membrane-associated protease RseP (regulator of RpoE activity)
MNIVPQFTALALALALLFPGGATAGTPAPKARPDARAAELAAAQADLQRAARRVAELSGAMATTRPRIAAPRVAGKPVVGVVLAPDAQAGVRIVAVTPRSGASKAGLRGGDRLVAIDGHELAGRDGATRVERARDLLDDLDTRKPVRIAYLRDGRKSTVDVLPALSGEAATYAWVGSDGDLSEAFGDVLFTGPVGSSDVIARAFKVSPPGVAPQLRREIARVDTCESDDCRLPLLAEAFRWNGLNLAAVDAQLGRYFGTSSGVLVLSTGESLAGLQPGDVLRRIDGKPVASPRDAMAALRAHPAGSRVAVEYLRDRKTATTQVTVPRAMAWPLPPRPPAPPRVPAAPRAPAAPPPPPAPPAAMRDDVAPVPAVASLGFAAPAAPMPVMVLESGEALEPDAR